MATIRLLVQNNNPSALSKVKMIFKRTKLIENLRTPFFNIFNGDKS